MEADLDYGSIWEQIVVGDEKSLVVFAHGTCVIFAEPPDDVEQAAIDLMKEWGPVHVGSPAGDFSTINLHDHEGWVVSGHHNDILTYVDPSEGEFDAESTLPIGLYGRGKRDEDASELRIVHVRHSK